MVSHLCVCVQRARVRVGVCVNRLIFYIEKLGGQQINFHSNIFFELLVFYPSHVFLDTCRVQSV
jgi:hypothetical protein